jgi:predicted outer membrane repeat protein
MIQRTVTVGAAQTLTIGPGVSVCFVGPYRFNVRGTLQALGTVTDSIRFTTDTLANPSRWRGVRFLTANNTSAMSYCLIEDGLGASPGDDRYGGGIEVQNCSPTFSRCTIRRCHALLDGGGIYCRDGGTPAFTDCDILNCVSQLGGGGGLFSRNSGPQLTRCTFRGNRTTLSGGGVGLLMHQPNIAVSNCVFDGNSAGDGGGLFVCSRYWNGAATMRQCVFSGNTATRGGAAFDTSAIVSYVNCLFNSNVAAQGGALYSGDNSRNTLNFVTLDDNQSSTAALHCRNDSIILTGSIISRTAQGSGVYFSLPRSAQITYNDFYANATGPFSGNTPQNLGQLTRINPWGDSCDVALNLLLDPRFVNPDSANYRLSDSSHCLAASQDLTHQFYNDFEGLSRPSPSNSQPDMGAYENRLSSPVPHLTGNLSGLIGPGRFLVGENVAVRTNDTLTLAAGTTLSFAGGTGLLVYGLLKALGTEQDSVILTVDTVVFPQRWTGLQFIFSVRGCSLTYCRFSAASIPSGNGNSNVSINQTNPVFSHCGFERGRRGVTCNYDSSRFLFCSFTGNEGGMAGNTTHAVFQDCDFSNNRALTGYYNVGGGVYFSGNPNFTRCAFTMNSANEGGVVYGSGGAVFSQCQFFQNSAASGGAVSVSGNTMVFADCQFSLNTASGIGGAAYVRGPLTFSRCQFTQNLATHGGAAYMEYTGTPLFEECLFTGHSGGTLYVTNNAIVRRCTLSGNAGTTSDAAGITVSASTSSTPRITSTIIGNSQGAGIKFQQTSGVTVRFCDFFANSGGNFSGAVNYRPVGIGTLSRTNARGDSSDQYLNVFLNPLFADTAAHDFHLTETSPCIDAGDSGLTHDSDGSFADIGAFAFTQAAHPPLACALISPADSSTFTVDRFADFAWNRSSDPDRWDTVTYVLKLQAPDTIVSVYMQQDTALSINLHGLHFPTDTPLHWWVMTHSCYPNTSVASDTFLITLHTLPPRPPQPFTLISPANDSILTTDSAVAFVWSASIDPDAADTVTYDLHLTAPGISMAMSVHQDTMYTMDLRPLGIPNDTLISWWVSAHSLLPDTSITSDTFRFVLSIPNRLGAGHPLPTVFALHAVYPNPFNPATRISYDLPQPCEVRLKVFDMLGRQVATLVDQHMPAGSYVVEWNAQAYPSGMYFTILTAADKQFVRKMLLLK